MKPGNIPACCDAIYVKELAHRTSNMLQKAIAAVHLGRRGNPDHLDDAMECLSAGAHLHTLLADHDAEPVDLGNRLELVARVTARSCGAVDGLKLDFDMGMLLVAPEDGRRVSMIVSELVTNSLKHALRSGCGSIRILLRDDALHTIIGVEDDGSGATWSRSGGQGRGIVDSLATSLGGKIVRTRTSSGGARVEVMLPSIALLANFVAGSA